MCAAGGCWHSTRGTRARAHCRFGSGIGHESGDRRWCVSGEWTYTFRGQRLVTRTRHTKPAGLSGFYYHAYVIASHHFGALLERRIKTKHVVWFIVKQHTNTPNDIKIMYENIVYILRVVQRQTTKNKIMSKHSDTTNNQHVAYERVRKRDGFILFIRNTQITQ